MQRCEYGRHSDRRVAMTRIAAMDRLSTRAWPAVRVAVGLLLVGTAGLKLAGIGVDPVPQVYVLSLPSWRLATIEVEAIVGLWLIAGLWQRAAWVCAFCLFAVLAVASAYFSWMGVSSCGCFGPLSVSPTWTLALDAALLVTLLAVHPPLREGHETRKQAIVAVIANVLAFAGSLMTIGGATLAAGEIGIAPVLAQARGERLVIDPPLVDLGERPGGFYVANIRVRNHTDHAVRLTGGTYDCACNTALALPISIPPHAEVDLPIRLAFTDFPGLREGRYQLLTDDDEEPTIGGRYTCRVVPQP